MHIYEVRPRKDKRGFDLISDALPFGRLRYAGANAISNAIGYAKHRSRSHDAVIRVYDESGNVIQKHEHKGDFPPRSRIDEGVRPRNADMTSGRALLWGTISVLSTLLLFGLSLGAFAFGRGDWVAFFHSLARVGALVVSLALSALVVFSGFGGMNPGKTEDRGNRWIFGPFLVLALGMAVLPAYLDGRNLWATDEVATPYVGLALLMLGGTLRLAAVFALGRRFTGLAAIQEGHRLETGGLYRQIRHPSYAGMLLYMAGYVLVFRCWLGLLLVAGTLAVLVARMNAEEALLESEFGVEYASYRRRTWRLIPWVY